MINCIEDDTFGKSQQLFHFIYWVLKIRIGWYIIFLFYTKQTYGYEMLRSKYIKTVCKFTSSTINFYCFVDKVSSIKSYNFEDVSKLQLQCGIKVEGWILRQLGSSIFGKLKQKMPKLIISLAIVCASGHAALQNILFLGGDAKPT